MTKYSIRNHQMDDLQKKLQETSNKLDHLIDMVHKIDDRCTTLEQKVEETHKRAATVLHTIIMDKISPGTLELLLPKLDIDWQADSGLNMIGVNLVPGNFWLMESASRVYQNIALTCSHLPLGQRKELFRIAIEDMSSKYGNNRSSVYSHYLLFLIQRCLRHPKDLLMECGNFESMNSWLPGYERAWGICIAAYAENGDDSHAKELLKSYQHHYGISRLEEYPVAAYHVRRFGLTNKYIDCSAQLYANELAGQGQGEIQKLLEGKTIAIVGGGPQEIGKGKGPEIDSHDVVIRINHLHQNHTEDYGSKTTIFFYAIAGGVTAVGEWSFKEQCSRAQKTGTLQAIWSPYPAVTMFIRREQLESFMDFQTNSTIPVLTSGYNETSTILNPERCSNPSSGYICLMLSKHYRPDLTFDNIYGLSHKYGAEFQYRHPGQNLPVVSNLFHPHCIEEEKQIITLLFQGKNFL